MHTVNGAVFGQWRERYGYGYFAYPDSVILHSAHGYTCVLKGDEAKKFLDGVHPDEMYLHNHIAKFLVAHKRRRQITNSH